MEKREAMTRLERILRKHAEQRRATALLRAATAVDRLQNMGIKVQIIGSLAEGRFQAHSDVDFLIERLADPGQRYTLESVVEDVLQDIPFDVVYADEVRWSEVE
ncbi:nucleotidyltransferase domain-containing protein [Acidithiobacillus sulfuriphilus]|uniref:nucleotidyltransferase domain-containing protein n=1 Tax=Acidithiobacillus sulfuriphilus TaxID=1867749 RepID=UPI003F5DB708